MSATFAELIHRPTREPITLAEVKAYMSITDNTHDGHLNILIFAATECVGGQLDRQLVESRWHVPEMSLKRMFMSPHRVIAARDGGYEIELGYTAETLPPMIRAALLHWVAWAFENADRATIEGPNYRYLRAELAEYEAGVADARKAEAA